VGCVRAWLIGVTVTGIAFALGAAAWGTYNDDSPHNAWYVGPGIILTIVSACVLGVLLLAGLIATVVKVVRRIRRARLAGDTRLR
jgi:hypothetical protein